MVRPPWTWCGYAGWSMPVQYSDLSIANSCLHTRSRASIFNVVSHMLQVQLCTISEVHHYCTHNQSTVTGSDAEQYLETVLVADLKNLPLNKGMSCTH